MPKQGPRSFKKKENQKRNTNGGGARVCAPPPVRVTFLIFLFFFITNKRSLKKEIRNVTRGCARPPVRVTFLIFFITNKRSCTVLYGTAQYSTVLHSTVQYCTALYSTVLYKMFYSLYTKRRKIKNVTRTGGARAHPRGLCARPPRSCYVFDFSFF